MMLWNSSVDDQHDNQNKKTDKENNFTQDVELFKISNSLGALASN